MNKKENPEVCPSCEDELLTRFDDDEYDNNITEDWMCEKCGFELKKNFKLIFIDWEEIRSDEE